MAYASQHNGALLILDDMITSDIAVNGKRGNLLKKLFYQGRHHKVSIILVSQKLRDIPLGMRINSSASIYAIRPKRKHSFLRTIISRTCQRSMQQLRNTTSYISIKKQAKHTTISPKNYNSYFSVKYLKPFYQVYRNWEYW